ncbi:hypothetical protein Esti_006547 [Eimeria stiedai]
MMLLLLLLLLMLLQQLPASGPTAAAAVAALVGPLVAAQMAAAPAAAPPRAAAAKKAVAAAAAAEIRSGCLCFTTAAAAAAAEATSRRSSSVYTPQRLGRGRCLVASRSSSSSRSRSSKLHAWGVPLFDDGVGRVRRPSVDFGYELGQGPASIAFDYLTSNLLAQRVLFQQREGSLIFVEEEGLGRAADTRLSVEQAAGGTRVDPDELKKIETVLPSFTRPDGSGLLRLLSACDGQFAFVYQGPLEHRLGVKEWTRFLITSAYPGAEVKFLTEHYADPDDRAGFHKGFVPDEEVSEYRKALRWRFPRLYQHDGDRPIPGGHRPSPQPIP